MSPWETAVAALQAAFTGPIARGLSLVAIVVGGLLFAFGEGDSKLMLAGIIFGVAMATARPRTTSSPPTAASSRPAARFDGENTPGGKVIQYSERDVPLIRAKVRYSTLVVLPQNEVILDFVYRA